MAGFCCGWTTSSIQKTIAGQCLPFQAKRMYILWDCFFQFVHERLNKPNTSVPSLIFISVENMQSCDKLKFASLWIIIQFKYINQLDAITSQVYYLMFVYGSTCFGRLHAHRHELNNCSTSGFTVGAWW